MKLKNFFAGSILFWFSLVPVFGAVIPVLETVHRIPGTNNLIATFGYENQDGGTYVMNPGNDNKVIGTVISSSLPSQFNPGYNEKAATITFHKDQVVYWQVKFNKETYRIVASSEYIQEITHTIYVHGGEVVFEKTITSATPEYAYQNITTAVGVEGKLDSQGNPYYYVKDHLGSTRQVVNANGTAVEELAYNSYGTIHELAQSTVDAKEKFTGKEFENNGAVAGVTDGMGLMYFGARYYDPELGAWLSTDPLEEYHNAYSYVGGKVINSFDPDGCSDCDLETGSGCGPKDRKDYWEAHPDEAVNNPDFLNQFETEEDLSNWLDIQAQWEAKNLVYGNYGSMSKFQNTIHKVMAENRLAYEINGSSRNVVRLNGKPVVYDASKTITLTGRYTNKDQMLRTFSSSSASNSGIEKGSIPDPQINHTLVQRELNAYFLKATYKATAGYGDIDVKLNPEVSMKFGANGKLAVGYSYDGFMYLKYTQSQSQNIFGVNQVNKNSFQLGINPERTIYGAAVVGAGYLIYQTGGAAAPVLIPLLR